MVSKMKKCFYARFHRLGRIFCWLIEKMLDYQCGGLTVVSTKNSHICISKHRYYGTIGAALDDLCQQNSPKRFEAGPFAQLPCACKDFRRVFTSGVTSRCSHSTHLNADGFLYTNSLRPTCSHPF